MTSDQQFQLFNVCISAGAGILGVFVGVIISIWSTGRRERHSAIWDLERKVRAPLLMGTAEIRALVDHINTIQTCRPIPGEISEIDFHEMQVNCIAIAKKLDEVFVLMQSAISFTGSVKIRGLVMRAMNLKREMEMFAAHITLVQFKNGKFPIQNDARGLEILCDDVEKMVLAMDFVGQYGQLLPMERMRSRTGFLWFRGKQK